MKSLPITTKLLWINSTLFLATIVILTVSLWWALNDQNATLSTKVDQAIEQEALDKLKASAGQYGEKVGGFINEAYRIPFSFAGMLEQTSGANLLSRGALKDSLIAVLSKNAQLSSMYAQFEANGYDNLDADYLSGATHSVAGAGSLELYYTRNDDGSVEHQQITDATEKYKDTLNEFGVREAEWYLCAKDNGKPCLMEPYLYEISPGNKALMTSLTVPVMRKGKFQGLVGVDLNLPIFQTMIEQLSKSLYQGKAKVTLLSSTGFIVAASHYDKFARPLAEAIDPVQAKRYLNLHQESGVLVKENDIVIAHPIQISLPDTQWSLLIEVPKQEVYSAAIVLHSDMKQMATSLGSLLLIVGALVSLAAVITVNFVIRGIISPLKLIQLRVENLASSEGDLTQSIEVTTHAELIALGNGFNAFISKLKLLIEDLKGLASQSQKESQSSADIAGLTGDSVNRQYAEIESVVTAVNQMSATALEVARASEQAATETHAMAGNVKRSEESLTLAMDFVATMSTESKLAKDAVGKVSESSNNISKIIEVISSIAEQTNLLALNAAIEAARAGEQGRGFAVVADEVRALASKTQISTDDIRKLIEALQSEVAGAATIIDKGAEQAQMAVSQTEQALAVLNTIVSQIEEVSSQVTQIATAAEQQSSVTEEVNRNVSGISESAAELSRLAGQTRQSSDNLAELVLQQHEQLSKLKT